ncbi:hypothetical protein C0991_003423 [Blastosporella zonata]|nr:hypothetical protein C0991_003423 [Blastosporella zonata]
MAEICLDCPSSISTTASTSIVSSASTGAARFGSAAAGDAGAAAVLRPHPPTVIYPPGFIAQRVLGPAGAGTSTGASGSAGCIRFAAGAGGGPLGAQRVLGPAGAGTSTGASGSAGRIRFAAGAGGGP